MINHSDNARNLLLDISKRSKILFKPQFILNLNSYNVRIWLNYLYFHFVPKTIARKPSKYEPFHAVHSQSRSGHFVSLV